ncbi:MAG: hypothetical protein HY782_15245 [Chloroflexi bacterium]|nr:hypothetical protein [Chloroflexota bacterium]
MLHSNGHVERQVQEWAAALEATQSQLAKREHDLRALQIQYRELQGQLAAERRRAEMLAALSDRFGAR